MNHPSPAALKLAEKIAGLEEVAATKNANFNHPVFQKQLALLIDEANRPLVDWFKAAVATVENCNEESCDHCADIMELYNKNVDDMLANHQPKES